MYVAVVLDLFSRKVVGWSISDSLSTPLVAEALRRAIEARRPVGSELLHHSDRALSVHERRVPTNLESPGIE